MTLSWVRSFLALAAALHGSRRVVLQDQVDLLAVDAAGGVDAIDVDAQRLDGGRVGAGGRAGQRAGQADHIGILRAAPAARSLPRQRGCQIA